MGETGPILGQGWGRQVCPPGRSPLELHPQDAPCSCPSPGPSWALPQHGTSGRPKRMLGQDGGWGVLWETAPWYKLGAQEADEYTAEQTPPEHRPLLTPQGGPGPCSSPCVPEGGGQLPGASLVPSGPSRAKRSWEACVVFRPFVSASPLTCLRRAPSQWPGCSSGPHRTGCVSWVTVRSGQAELNRGQEKVSVLPLLHCPCGVIRRVPAPEPGSMCAW